MTTTTTPLLLKNFAGDDNARIEMSRKSCLNARAALSTARPFLLYAGATEALATVKAAQEALEANFPAEPKIERGMQTEVYHLSADISEQVMKAMVAAEAALYEDEAAIKHQAIDVIQSVLRGSGRRLVTVGYDRVWMPMDIFVVVFDETSDYDLSTFPNGDKIERIEGVYFFDRNMHIHQCSIIPDYDLEHLEQREVLKDGLEDQLGETAYEILRDEVNSAVRDSVGETYTTRTVSSIERFLEQHGADRGKVYHFGDPGGDWNEVDGDDDQQKHRAIMESVREELQSNSRI